MFDYGTDYIHTNAAGTQYINTGIVVNYKDKSTYVITVTDETADPVKCENTDFSYSGSKYYAYSYKTCNKAVGTETHPELPSGWTSQVDSNGYCVNYNNFLNDRK